MKKIFLAIGVVAVLLALHGPSRAQSEGPYIAGAIGLSLPADVDVTGNGVNTTLSSKRGFGTSVAIGNSYGKNVRAEAELNFRRSSVNSVSGGEGSGDTSALGFMLNGFYDFDIGSAWRPYLGIGAGGASVSYNNVSPVSGARIDDRDMVFSYQGIVGASYKVNDRTDFFTDYRYVGTSGLDLQTDSSVKVNSDSREHRVMIGLRWSFGAPKPVVQETMAGQPAPITPAPMPAPAPVVQAQTAPPPETVPDVPRRYLVFFDWDKFAVTDDARAIIQQAVINSRNGKLTRIEATGHTDRSGTVRYNLALSERRAKAVQAELVRLGVPGIDIIVRWKGEQDPLVQTPDGVREPQNRRVEIVLN